MPRLPDLPINRTIGELIADIKRPRPNADTSWMFLGPSEAHGIDFTNSAVNWSGATTLETPTSWYIADNGEVKTRGKLKASVGVIFRLPEEARPEYSQMFTCSIEDGGVANVMVDTEGFVTLVNFQIW